MDITGKRLGTVEGTFFDDELRAGERVATGLPSYDAALQAARKRHGAEAIIRRPDGTYDLYRITRTPGLLTDDAAPSTREDLAKGGTVAQSKLSALGGEVAGFVGLATADNYELKAPGKPKAGRLALGGSHFSFASAQPIVERTASSGNQVELLVDGQDAFQKMRALIADAQQSIHLEMYILRDDATGRPLIDLLKAKRAAGLEVRVTFDYVGSDRNQPLLKELKAAGIEVLRYREPGLTNLTTMGQRTHRKLLIVDGAAGMTGGMNVGREYEHHWHDVMVAVRGPAVHELQHQFLQVWEAHKGPVPEAQRAKLFPPPTLPGASTVAVGVTTQHEHRLKAEVYAALDRATTSIDVENPYMVDPGFLDRLAAAAKRGVKVRVVLPAKGDQYWLDKAIAHHYPRLLAAGVEIYLYPGRPVHTKAMVVDGTWATVGSMNFSQRAMAYNHELNLIFDDAAVAQDIKRRLFDVDVKASKRLLKDDPGVFERIQRWLFDKAAPLAKKPEVHWASDTNVDPDNLKHEEVAEAPHTVDQRQV